MTEYPVLSFQALNVKGDLENRPFALGRNICRDDEHDFLLADVLYADSDAVPSVMCAGRDFNAQRVLCVDGRNENEQKSCSEQSEFSYITHDREPRKSYKPNEAFSLVAKCSCRRCAIKAEPGVGGLQFRIDVVDVFYALIVEPILQSLAALLGVHRNSFLPRRAAAQHA